MNEQQYKATIAEIRRIEAALARPERRKDTRLILRHMDLCGRIHAYEAAQHVQERGQA